MKKVFLSYSQRDREYIDFVEYIAHNLQNNGVEVLFDRWDVIAGQDLHLYMERMVNDNSVDKVLILCDSSYQRKANTRIRGVGKETLIISPSVYKDARQTKFIPIITEFKDDHSDYLPTYLNGRRYIDFSSEQNIIENIKDLLDAINDLKPQRVYNGTRRLIYPTINSLDSDKLDSSKITEYERFKNVFSWHKIDNLSAVQILSSFGFNLADYLNHQDFVKKYNLSIAQHLAKII